MLKRLNSNGTTDPSFKQPNSSTSTFAITIQSDGRILVGGDVTVNNQSRRGIARLTTAGALDESFNPGTGITGGSIFAVKAQTDGKVVVGGNFTTVNGFSRPKITRLDENGTLDQSFTPEIGRDEGTPMVKDIVVHSSGHIVVGGWFTIVNSVSQKGIARLNSDGTLDQTYIPEAELDYASISPFSNGKLLVNGNMQHSDTGVPLPPIVRLLGDPVLDMRRVNSDAVLSWDEAGYRLQSASAVDSEFIDIPNAASPFTNAPSGGQQYFRLFAD